MIASTLRRPALALLVVAATAAAGCAGSESIGDAAASVESTQAALDRDQAKADAARRPAAVPTRAFVPDRRDRRPTDATR